jgi:quercetin dioxygenase-like cupin family protein
MSVRPATAGPTAFPEDRMAATRVEHAIDGREAAMRVFEAERCSAPRSWENGPGDTYGRHAHDYHKVLFCLDGSITFHLDDGDLTLRGGDRLDLPPSNTHAATVGPKGCRCIEAWR